MGRTRLLLQLGKEAVYMQQKCVVGVTKLRTKPWKLLNDYNSMRISNFFGGIYSPLSSFNENYWHKNIDVDFAKQISSLQRPAVSHEYFVPNLFGSLHRNHFGLPTSFPVSFTPLERARQCYFSRQFSKASSDTDTTVDWRISSSNKLIQTRTKLENAKHKLEDAKQNFIEDIQDTKARMRVKMDEIIERENIFTIPNFLCISRIVAAPFLCHLVLTGSYDMALGLFMLAGATDLADGWIARVFPSQASKLGSFLDPLADKVLVAVLFLALTCNGLIPIPLTGLIIYRDVVIIAAASYVRYRSLPAPRTLMRYFDATHATVQLSPTLISKVNTAVQLSLITATLAQPVLNFPSPAAMTALWCVTIITTIASGVSYIFSRNTYIVLDKQLQQQLDKEREEEQRKN